MEISPHKKTFIIERRMKMSAEYKLPEKIANLTLTTTTLSPAIEARPITPKPSSPPKEASLKGTRKQKKTKAALMEEQQILQEIEKTKSALDHVHQKLEYELNPDLIDSYIYELQALNMRYKFYIELCKEQQISATRYAQR